MSSEAPQSPVSRLAGGLRRRELLGLAGLGALRRGLASPVPSRLETFGEWLRAGRPARSLALQSCQDRIRELDASIHAWVRVQPQPATGPGPLADIPFGVKDIIETQDLPTEFGSPIYKGRQGAGDAAIVRDLRRRGGILLGKTHTTAFAYRTPGPTRNPRNLDHTPGGSSSGSAAAVAAGMIPFALGTQTRGSVLRPASYCGIAGFKPSYGLLSTEGVLPLAKSLDTLGLFTSTAADMLLLWETLGYSPGRPQRIPLGFAEPLPEVEPEMAAGFRAALSALRGAGVALKPVSIAPLLAELDAAAVVVMNYEGARFHELRFQEHGSRLEHLADLVREGLQIPDTRYAEARLLISRGREDVSRLFKATPVILTPAATGPAPAGLASTGDPRMNAPWTALGTPAISIPMPVGKALPLGLQLTAGPGQEATLLQTAVRLEKVFQARSSPAPPAVAPA